MRSLLLISTWAFAASVLAGANQPPEKAPPAHVALDQTPPAQGAQQPMDARLGETERASHGRHALGLRHLVEVEEDHRLRPACATPVAADMEVHVDSPRLRAYRKSILELVFAEGNHVCAVCVSNGNCELQDMAVACGMDHVRYDEQHPQRKVDASHPKYVFDPNRCILCTRCVRVCDEIEGAHVWDISERGSSAELVTELHKPWGEAMSCTRCGKCVAVCPTGSLFHQASAVGEMEHSADMIRVLASARKRHEWVDPEVPA